MRFLNLFALFVVFDFFSLAWAQEPPPLRFSLKESVEYALKNNLDFQNAQLAEKISIQDVRNTIGIGLPKISGTARYDRQISVPSTILPDFISPLIYKVLDAEKLLPFPQGREFGFAPAQFGTTNVAQVGLELNQLLLDASYFIALRNTGPYKALAEKTLRQAAIELVDVVHRDYYRLLIAEKYTQLTRQNRDRLQSILEAARLRYQNGFAGKLDVDRLQVGVNLLDVDLQKALTQRDLSRRLLNFRMGLPIQHPTEQSDELQIENITTLIDEKPPFTLHNTYQRLQMTEKLYFSYFQLEKATLYPSLSLRVTAGYNAGNDALRDFIDDEWYPYSIVSLNFQVPILDGFRRYSDIQRKKYVFLQKKNDRIQALRALEQSHIQAQTDLRAKLAAVTAQKDNLALAHAVYQASKAKYEQGIESNLDVLDALVTLKEVEIKHYNAVYEAMIANLELKKAKGTLYLK